jgi:hypothetical protein
MKSVHNNLYFFTKQRGIKLPLLLLIFVLLCTGNKAQPPQMQADEAALLQTLRYHTNTGFKLINIENIVEKHGQLLNTDRYVEEYFAGIRFLKYSQFPYSANFSKYLSPIVKQYLQDSLPGKFYDSLWQSGQPNSKALWLLLKHATGDTVAVKNYIALKLSKLSGIEEKSFAASQLDLCKSIFPTVIQKIFDYTRLYPDPDAIAVMKYANSGEVYMSSEAMALIKYLLIFKSCTSDETLKKAFNDKPDLLVQTMVADAGVSKGLSFARMLPDLLGSKLAMPIKIEVLLHQLKHYPSSNVVDSLQSIYRQIPQYYPYSIRRKERDNFEEFRKIITNILAHNTLTAFFLTHPGRFADSCMAALQSGNRYNWDLLANGIKVRYEFAPAFLQQHITLLNSISPSQADRLDSISDVFIGYGRYDSFKRLSIYSDDSNKDSLFEKLFTTPAYFAAVEKVVLSNTAMADSLTDYTVPTLTAMINKGNFLQAGYAWQYVLVQKPALLTRVLANADAGKIKQHLFFMASLLQAKDCKKQLTRYFISSFANIAANKNTSDRQIDRQYTTHALQYFKDRENKLFKKFVRTSIADTTSNYDFALQLLNAYPQYLYNGKVINTAIRNWYLNTRFAPNRWSNILPLLNKQDEAVFINRLYEAVVSSREQVIKSRLQNRF